LATNQQALGRLTATDTASLIAREIGSTADADKIEAFKRIIGTLKCLSRTQRSLIGA